MPERDEHAQSESGNLLRRTLPLETETTRFILVSVLDIVMTYLVIRYSHEGRTDTLIGEGNPIPAMFISRWGIPGMVVFKMIIVAFVTVLAQVIARFSLLKARFMLNFGTVIVSCVVLYSLWLLLGVWRWN
jgi:hypothetical protein